MFRKLEFHLDDIRNRRDSGNRATISTTDATAARVGAMDVSGKTERSGVFS
jgi:hypothetical protein